MGTETTVGVLRKARRRLPAADVFRSTSSDTCWLHTNSSMHGGETPRLRAWSSVVGSLPVFLDHGQDRAPVTLPLRRVVGSTALFVPRVLLISRRILAVIQWLDVFEGRQYVKSVSRVVSCHVVTCRGIGAFSIRDSEGVELLG